jgi:NAD(P)-dependent dehydrogenase (short-subunit alcohol dehydrogenase family)
MIDKRVAIVTGASVSQLVRHLLSRTSTDIVQSGMGTALSIDLAGKGWQVAMADIQPNADLQKQLGDNASYHHCDVADYDSQAKCFQEVWDKYGRLDALCANAGIVDKRCEPRLVCIQSVARLTSRQLDLCV